MVGESGNHRYLYGWRPDSLIIGDKQRFGQYSRARHPEATTQCGATEIGRVSQPIVRVKSINRSYSEFDRQ
jgi:hypothetical protein